MVDITLATIADGTHRNFWNISHPFGLGIVGNVTDVMLVQYMLFVWRDGASIIGDSFPYSLADVDGIWGPKSNATFEALLHATPFVNSTSRDDQLFDRFPQSANGFTDGGGPLFKVITMQNIYVTAVRTFDLSDDDESVRMRMPDDGRCPPFLAGSLRIALAATPT